MTIEIRPGIARGRVFVPASKSAAHRTLLLAALSEGKTVIRDLPGGDDVRATAEALRTLGVPIREEDGCLTAEGRSLTELRAVSDGREIFVGESGTTLRLLVPLCLAIGGETVFRGSPRLFERPLSVFRDIARAQGLGFDLKTDSLTVSGNLGSGDFVFPGDISSQFATGLLLTLPHLPGDSTLAMTGKIVSAPYLAMTEKTLSDFGIRLTGGAGSYGIPGGQRGKARDVVLPSDASSAAVYGALSALGGEVELPGYDGGCQADAVFGDAFRRLSDGFCTVDVEDCPDLSPLLMAVACLKHGCRLTGTSRLKYKESDRGERMAEELRACGVSVTVGDGEIFVSPGAKAPETPLRSHGDHRIAMALSVLLTAVGGRLENAECVNKSLPDFYKTLASLGIGVRESL